MNNLKDILINKKTCKSVWFMRQAGRYLPEFRKIRQLNQNFINLCLDSDLSSEITLQPIKRFDLDSAIIFSDILLVPYALGQNVDFSKNKGPKLSKFEVKTFLKVTEKEFTKILNPIYRAIEITRKRLDKSKSLISFIGAPWTLLIYMFDLKKENELKFETLEKEKTEILHVKEKLINFLCIHVRNQINAGSDVVQIFDSWAGLLPDENFNEFCLEPNKEIVEFCKKGKIPSICFPKGIKGKYETFNKIVKSEGINIDADVDPEWAKQKLKNVVLQGGLNPKFLLDPEEDIFKKATKYIETFKDTPYIFNLGHGLLPQTDPDKVSKLVNFYRNFK